MATLALGCSAPPALAQTPHALPVYRLYADIGTTLDAEKTRVGALGVLVPARAPDWLPRNAGPMSLHWDLSVNGCPRHGRRRMR